MARLNAPMLALLASTASYSPGNGITASYLASSITGGPAVAARPTAPPLPVPEVVTPLPEVSPAEANRMLARSLISPVAPARAAQLSRPAFDESMQNMQTEAALIALIAARPKRARPVIAAPAEVAPRPVVRTLVPLARLAARLRSLHLAVAAALVAWCRTLVASLLPARAEVEHRPAAA